MLQIFLDLDLPSEDSVANNSSQSKTKPNTSWVQVFCPKKLQWEAASDWRLNNATSAAQQQISNIQSKILQGYGSFTMTVKIHFKNQYSNPLIGKIMSLLYTSAHAIILRQNSKSLCYLQYQHRLTVDTIKYKGRTANTAEVYFNFGDIFC